MASAGYHAQHSALGIPEPARLDPYCAVAALAASLTSTPDHPYATEAGAFVAAGGLQAGDKVITLDGPDLEVASITWQRNEEHQATVYNMTVDGDHSYFAGTAGGGAWVHNCGDEGELSGPARPDKGGRVVLQRGATINKNKELASDGYPYRYGLYKAQDWPSQWIGVEYKNADQELIEFADGILRPDENGYVFDDRGLEILRAIGWIE